MNEVSGVDRTLDEQIIYSTRTEPCRELQVRPYDLDMNFDVLTEKDLLDRQN